MRKVLLVAALAVLVLAAAVPFSAYGLGEECSNADELLVAQVYGIFGGGGGRGGHWLYE